MKKLNLTKAKKRTIIISVITAVVVLAIIITNIFIPVKYLSSYLVARNKGAEIGVMRVRFVDVGYGDCIIVELPDGKNMVIDAGEDTSSNQKRILKFLNKCDIDTIDYLVCTSVSKEHCAGLSELLNYKKVKRIFMPYCKNTYVTKEFRNFAVALTGINADCVVSQYGTGESNEESGYFFTFLSPSVITNPGSQYEGLVGTPSKEQIDAASAVMWLEYLGTSFLFTSDATDEVLNSLCKYYENDKENFARNGNHTVKLENCNVLQVANHGSKASASSLLYDLVKPETAVISVGENGFGCPSVQAVSNAVNYVGEKLYRTDEHGTVTIEVTSAGYAVK